LIALVEAVSTVASLKICHFRVRDGPFFALQMVYFSSLHDEGRLDDALHQFHSIELVNALGMVVSWLIFAFHIVISR
jgi:hypothetical protein